MASHVARADHATLGCTFVLVHGAWHGAWCWSEVATRLQQAGHPVIAPDLPGLATSDQCMAGAFGLADHIRTVEEAVRAAPQAPILLVAHSYAGMIARALEGRCPDRLAHVAYVEAVLPEPGQALLDLVPVGARVQFDALRESTEAGDVLRPPGVERFAIPDERLARAIAARLTCHPWRTWSDPLGPDLVVPPRRLPRTYVYASDRNPNPYRDVIDSVRADPSWRVLALTGGHELMLTNPAALAAILLDAARDVAASRSSPPSQLCSSATMKEI